MKYLIFLLLLFSCSKENIEENNLRTPSIDSLQNTIQEIYPNCEFALYYSMENLIHHFIYDSIYVEIHPDIVIVNDKKYLLNQ